MAKVRIYELARELGRESKDVLAKAQELGIEVKTASSGLDEEAVELVKLAFDEQAGATPEPSGASAAAEEPEAPHVGAEAVETPGATEAIPAEAPEEGGSEEEGSEEETAEEERILLLEPGVTPQQFARMVHVRPSEVVKQLMTLGEMVPIGSPIPAEVLEALGSAFGYEVLVGEGEEAPEVEERPAHHVVEYEDAPETLRLRPPVVTVMGHVDHGKTQLLDTIRRANVVAGEAGGITQHIGAYQVEHEGQRITFIDTPGHQAFTALRARGAEVTDIVVLVVAADDGVMPQTVEAIDHAKAAGVPIIVAINKIDLPTANPANVRAQLTQHGIVVEQLGGDVPSVEVSALTGQGIDELLEMIALVAEVEELKANPKAPAVGTVIESQLDVGRGPVATVIVQRGTLERGDAIVAGHVAGRVRAMFDDQGRQVKVAEPSTPVLVMGWDEVPTAGDMFEVVKNERIGRKIAKERLEEMRAKQLVVPTAAERLNMLLEQLRREGEAELRIVVKADTQGSLEAIREAVGKIRRDDAVVRVILGGVGGITANDITLAEASEAVVYGFNVRPDAKARAAAKERGIDVRTFSIIYELLDDVEQLLVGELAPEEVERFLGVAEVRATFRAPRFGLVAGCYVTEGVIRRNARARLVRDGVVVYDGRIASLRRFKDDVAEVAAGYECGIGLENFRDIKVGDTIESYEVREVART